MSTSAIITPEFVYKLLYTVQSVITPGANLAVFGSEKDGINSAVSAFLVIITLYKMLSYRRQTELQGALVLAKSRRLELGDNILMFIQT